MREPQPTSDVEYAAALASMSHADRHRAVEPAAQELHDRSRDRLTTEEVALGFVVGRDHRMPFPGTRLTVGEGVYGSSACHPSVPPDTPKGRDRGEELEQSPNAAQAALEERGQAAGELSRASLDGFFSAGGGWTAASHMPAGTAPCSGGAMTNKSRAKRAAWRVLPSSRANPPRL